MNTAGGGPVTNTGAFAGDLFTAGGALGAAADRPSGELRVEVEALGRGTLTGQTNSVFPPEQYAVQATDSWTVMANLWREYSVSDRLGVGAAGSTLAVVAALIAGLVIAVQQAINGRVGAAARNAWTAAWVNFTLGTVMLGAVLGLAWAFTEFDPGSLPAGPWWLYIGGTIGVLFIAAAAWVVQRLGVLLFALLTITGQLTGAVLLDWLAPADGVTFHVTLIIGVLLAGVAVAIGGLSSWAPRMRGTRSH